MRKPLTGAEAAAEAMRQVKPDVVAAYPITPQTPIVEKYAAFVADGLVRTEMIPVESEHSALSAVVGASAAGVRAMTATSSVGLALMWEVVNAASGLGLPIVMNVVNRALSAPINIHCDHSDSMGCRDAGWIQIYSENGQEAYDNTILATKLAEMANVPTMVMQDGFITSHSVEPVDILDDKAVENFVGKYRNPKGLLGDNPQSVGPFSLPNSFFEFKIAQEKRTMKAKELFLKIGAELSRLTKRKYYYFEPYHTDDADAVIVTMSSTAGTAKAVVDRMRTKGKKVGLLKMVLFRPFPYAEVADALKGIKQICVLDRSFSFGANAPLYGEIKNAVNDPDVNIHGVVFGLGGRDIFERNIEGIFNSLLAGKEPKNYPEAKL
ncbi:MAG: pyruvate ferredoxin oxidoreductase [Candidatus Aenigmatarchaeota archaeon]